MASVVAIDRAPGFSGRSGTSSMVKPVTGSIVAALADSGSNTDEEEMQGIGNFMRKLKTESGVEMKNGVKIEQGVKTEPGIKKENGAGVSQNLFCVLFLDHQSLRGSFKLFNLSHLFYLFCSCL